MAGEALPKTTLQHLKEEWLSRREMDQLFSRAARISPPRSYIDRVSTAHDHDLEIDPRATLFGQLDIIEEHPVLLARQMLQVALYICHLPARLENRIFDGLSNTDIVLRLHNQVTAHVTMQPSFVPTVEMIQCFILQRNLLQHIGMAGRAVTLSRRAVELGFAAGLNQPGTQLAKDHSWTTCDAQFMWDRIISDHLDLCLSLNCNSALEDITTSRTPVPGQDPLETFNRVRRFVTHQVLLRDTRVMSLDYDSALSHNDCLDQAYSHLNMYLTFIPVPSVMSACGFKYCNKIDQLELSMTQMTNHKIQLHTFVPCMLNTPTWPSTHANSTRQRLESTMNCIKAAREIVMRFQILMTRDNDEADFGCTVRVMGYHAATILLLAHAKRNILDDSLETEFLEELSDRMCMADFLWIRNVAAVGVKVEKHYKVKESADALELLQSLLQFNTRSLLISRTGLLRLPLDRSSDSQNTMDIVVDLLQVGQLRYVRMIMSVD